MVDEGCSCFSYAGCAAFGEQTVYIAAQWDGNKIALRRAKLSQKWCFCGILLPSADAE